MKLPIISFDTNVLIFGLREIDPFAEVILKNLFLFDIRICAQVEKELRNNVSESEFRHFYAQVEPLSTFHIVYQSPAEKLLSVYRQLGLKTGDAKIAAFCEQEEIEIFVTENRHFLQELPERSFEIVDSETFCQVFSLEE